jgi:hypothetical protein
MLFQQRCARTRLRSRVSVMALVLALLFIAASAMAQAPRALAANPCYGCTYAATSDGFLWATAKPLDPNTPQEWHKIGPASATTTMVGDALTRDGKLWAINNHHLAYRNTSDEYDTWKQVDTAYGINALTQTPAQPSGMRIKPGSLWGVAGNTLWARLPTTLIAPWIARWDGTGIVALTAAQDMAAQDKLFAVRRNELWYRDAYPVDNTTDWTQVRDSKTGGFQDAIGIVSLATDGGGSLIAVSSDNRLWVRAPYTDKVEGWTYEGTFSPSTMTPGARVVAIASSQAVHFK